MALIPVNLHDADMDYWLEAGKVMMQGLNPYPTGRLNYPPLWMLVLYLLMKVHLKTGIDFFHVLQLFLIACESIVIVVVHGMIRRLTPGERAWPIVLWGIALNPYCIFQVCQHGNFDPFVTVWIVLGVDWLLRFRESREGVDWLLACFFAGVGVLAKVVPIMLAPVLVAHVRMVGRKSVIFGAALLLLPVALGMSIIYVLSPEAVTKHVLMYRSLQGWGGATGLLVLMHHTPWIPAYVAVFTRVLPVLLAGVMLLFYFRGRALRDGDICLAGALLLASLPTFGSGYSSQYLYWFLPLLMVTYGCYGQRWRMLLRLTLIAGAMVSFCEYGFFNTHGAFMMHFFAHGKGTILDHIDSLVKLRSGETKIRLPLYVALVAVEICGMYLLAKRMWGGEKSERESFSEQVAAEH